MGCSNGGEMCIFMAWHGMVMIMDVVGYLGNLHCMNGDRDLYDYYHEIEQQYLV